MSNPEIEGLPFRAATTVLRGPSDGVLVALGTRVVLVQANEAFRVRLVSSQMSAHFLLMFANISRPNKLSLVLCIGEPAVIDERGLMYLCGIHGRDA